LIKLGPGEFFGDMGIKKSFSTGLKAWGKTGQDSALFYPQVLHRFLLAAPQTDLGLVGLHHH
jgi:hypothetical protein